MGLEFILGILLILTFVGMVLYCVKGFNLMIGFLAIATIWTLIPLIGNQFVPNPTMEGASLINVLTNVYQTGPQNWGAVLVNIMFGAWFGRTLLETGIASTIIRKTVELGGDKPAITLILLNIVVAIIFTSMTGAGPVISIAVIVIPILLSLGIPRPLALFSFMGSVAGGVYLNIVQFEQYQAFFQPATDKTYFYEDYFSFGLTGTILLVSFVSIWTIIHLKKKKTSHAWAAQNSQASSVKEAPGIALITPILPVIGVIGFKLPVIFGFIFGSLYAMAVCGKFKNGFKESCRLINKLYADGVVDTAPLVGFLLIMACFNVASSYCAPYFQAVLGNIIPTSALILSLFFAVLAPLGWFRGPLTLVGAGSATLAVIKSSPANYPITYLYPLFMTTTCGMQHFDLTQSWVAWGLGYAKVEAKEHIKLSLPVCWTVAVIMAFVAFAKYGNF